jgi:hypothetical protein
MFEIVKREHARFVRLLVLQPIPPPQGGPGHVRQANVFERMLEDRSFFDGVSRSAEASADHKSNQVS